MRWGWESRISETTASTYDTRRSGFGDGPVGTIAKEQYEQRRRQKGMWTYMDVGRVVGRERRGSIGKNIGACEAPAKYL